MHKGVFEGNNLLTNCNILILGESHHHTIANDPDYTTEGVVKNYFLHPNDNDYRFFDKIANCFGYRSEQREVFWNKVRFGNYVDEPDCSVKTDRAKKLIEENRQKYNRELFEFVNQKEIDVIFCFSREVYKNLPDRASFEETGVCFETPRVGKRDWIDKFIYKPGARPDDNTALKKQLTVYGFRHPSARCGFSAENYREVLQKEIQI